MFVSYESGFLARVEDETHATTQAAGHEAHAEPNALALDFQLGLFTVIIFLGLLALLTKYAWKPILSALEHREKSIADNIESARRANEDAQATLKAYEKKMADIAEQANGILAEAKKDSLTLKEQILAEANQAAMAQRDRTLAEIRAAKDAAVRELAEKSAETAVGLAGSIIGRSLNKDDHRSLIDESINGFVNRN
jgi:F-type H+-transporting ATPase subunit b